MSKAQEKRKALRDKLRRRMGKFPKVQLDNLLERLSDLPTDLRSRATRAIQATTPIRESFKDLTDNELVFATKLQKAGMPYREIEPVLRLKGMNGMNSYRAINSKRARKAVSAARKAVAA